MSVRPVEAVLAKLERVKREQEGQWVARCPAHEDKTPSLSVGEGADGRALVLKTVAVDESARDYGLAGHLTRRLVEAALATGHKSAIDGSA